MRIFRDLNQLPVFKNSVITIGTFDGVHLGHQRLIERIKYLSKSIDGENIIITFHPHPRMVIHPEDKSLRLLNTVDEKIALLEKYGVDNVVVVPFSRDFSGQTAESYISSFLVRSFQPRYIVIGFNHRFGKDRTGDYTLLEKMKNKYGYEMVEINKETLDDMDISSTRIREALMMGDVKLAGELLGHPYSLTGTVVKGLQNGRKLGYPTANLMIHDEYKLIPRQGIYAVRAIQQGVKHGGMMSIGMNPTFDGKVQTIEVNILDFDSDIYGEALTIEPVEYIREEKKFDSVDDLIKEIKQDETNTRRILSDAGVG